MSERVPQQAETVMPCGYGWHSFEWGQPRPDMKRCTRCGISYHLNVGEATGTYPRQT